MSSIKHETCTASQSDLLTSLTLLEKRFSRAITTSLEEHDKIGPSRALELFPLGLDHECLGAQSLHLRLALLQALLVCLVRNGSGDFRGLALESLGFPRGPKHRVTPWFSTSLRNDEYSGESHVLVPKQFHRVHSGIVGWTEREWVALRELAHGRHGERFAGRRDVQRRQVVKELSMETWHVMRHAQHECRV